MNKVIAKFIADNGKVDNDKMINVLSSHLNNEELENFMKYSYGLVDLPVVAEKSNVEESAIDKVCIRESVNYITGMVNYSYKEKVVRYFETEKEKNDFEKGGWRYGNYEKTDKYTFEGTKIEERRSCKYIEDWNKNSVD